MSNQELFHKALQLTQECLQLVHQEDFDQFVVLETERRSAMQACLKQPSKANLELMNKLQKACQALEQELKGVLGDRPSVPDNPYDTDGAGSGYSATA